MIDIGANLTNSQFAADTDQVLNNAFSTGIETIILTGTDLDSSRQNIELCEKFSSQYPGKLFSTAGVHPHDAKDWNSEISAQIIDLLQSPYVVAVGETGLDFNRNFSPKDQQIKAFEEQLEIAANSELPLFLHERDAYSTQIEILRSYRDQIGSAVIHCFTGDKTSLYAYLDLDLHIGITGWVCDERRGTDLAKLVANIPLDRLMVETDAPFLLPRNIDPKPKSRRNEPENLKWVIKKIAQCCGMDEQEIDNLTAENARRFFGLASL